MTPIKDLLGYLPHQGEMIWIDYVLEASAEGGTCIVVIDDKKHYYFEENIRQSSYIEWMAQGFGFVNACFIKEQKINSSIRNAFLVGFNNVYFSDSLPENQESILIITNLTRTIGPISYVAGRVQSKETGFVYCEAQIKLFSN
jgi:predicted hotdog family 3-hydroxylacyl-ACP dehydratase